MNTPVWTWKLLTVAAFATLAVGAWMLVDSLQATTPAPTRSNVPAYNTDFNVSTEGTRRDANAYAHLWEGDYDSRTEPTPAENTSNTTVDEGPRYRSTDEAAAILSREVEVPAILYAESGSTDQSVAFIRLGTSAQHVPHTTGERFETSALTGVVNRIQQTAVDVTFVLADQPGYPYYAVIPAGGQAPTVRAPLEDGATFSPGGLGDVELETPRTVSRAERETLAHADSIEREFAAVRCHASFDPIAGTFEGVILDEVPDASAAARHGFLRGDRVIAVNGQPVRSVADLRRAVEECATEPEIEVTFVRDGRTVLRRYVIDAD